MTMMTLLILRTILLPLIRRLMIRGQILRIQRILLTMMLLMKVLPTRVVMILQTRLITLLMMDPVTPQLITVMVVMILHRIMAIIPATPAAKILPVILTPPTMHLLISLPKTVITKRKRKAMSTSLKYSKPFFFIIFLFLIISFNY